MSFSGSQPLGSFGHYRLLRKIARGGMAEVYLAVLTGKVGFEKVVVLKRVLPELSEIDEFVQTFLDEARLAARLDHPNIGHVYDLGEFGGQYYLAMEYLAGEDLASVIQQCRRAGKLPPIDVAVGIARSVSEGLAFAHSATDVSGRPLGIVHRDVSPSNIVATYHGQVKVIDFGIARAESNLLRTAGGRPKGKVQYMAPEQAAGGTIDARCDLFSTGVLLHELLTTQRLFRRATDAETQQAVLAAKAPAPSQLRPEVPAELDVICLKALARDPALRHQTASELAFDLKQFAAANLGGNTESRVAEFLKGLFPAERSLKKLRIGQGMPLAHINDEVTAVMTFEGLTPLRTNPRPATARPPGPSAPAAPGAPAKSPSTSPPPAPAVAVEPVKPTAEVAPPLPSFAAPSAKPAPPAPAALAIPAGPAPMPGPARSVGIAFIVFVVLLAAAIAGGGFALGVAWTRGQPAASNR